MPTNPTKQRMLVGTATTKQLTLLGVAWLILGVWFVVDIAVWPGIALLAIGVTSLAYAIRHKAGSAA